MRECPNCNSLLQATRLACDACGLGLEGSFHSSRLARLSAGHQELVEQIVLAAGNLKDVCSAFQISYPTLRKRLDGLIGALQTLRRDDELTIADLLSAVEEGDIGADQADRLIRELNGKS